MSARILFCRQFRVDPELGAVYGPRGKRVGWSSTHGYLRVHAGRGSASVHRIVWESVHGPIPVDREINHINGIKSDNRIANLELVTRGENIAHAYRHGLRNASGERNARAKLTEQDVREIRASRGTARKALAAKYGVSEWTINGIKSGLVWRSVA